MASATTRTTSRPVAAAAMGTKTAAETATTATATATAGGGASVCAHRSPSMAMATRPSPRLRPRGWAVSCGRSSAPRPSTKEAARGGSSKRTLSSAAMAAQFQSDGQGDLGRMEGGAHLGHARFGRDLVRLRRAQLRRALEHVVLRLNTMKLLRDAGAREGRGRRRGARRAAEARGELDETYT